MLPPEFRQALVDGGLSAMDRDAASSLPQNPTAATPLLSSSTPEPETRFTLTTYDGCLVAYHWQDWQEMETKFMRIANPSSGVRDFRRMVLGGAEVHTLDAQGRIRLSQDHREYAGLDKDVALIGLINRFEIWNPVMFKQKMAGQSLNDVSDELSASGIDFAF